MRIIKFRMWDKGNEIMTMNAHHLRDFARIAARHEDNQDQLLMQFIGICDKDGKEIYEGDTLRYWRENAKSGVVTYDESIAAFVVGYDEFGDNITDIEVISNIHENPDKL